MVHHELAGRVLERALKQGGELGELYVEDRGVFGLSLDDGRVERPLAGRERGASVRVVRGDASYFGYVDGLGEEGLLRVADSVAQAVRADARAPQHPGAVRQAAGHPVITRPEEVDTAVKADLLRSCDERARAAGPEVVQVTVGYAESRRQIEVFNSDGLAVSDDRTRLRLSTQVVARRGGNSEARVETGSDTRGGHAGFELLAADPEAVAESAARKPLTMLDAVHAPTGRLPVVVGNGFGGVLLHEAV